MNAELKKILESIDAGHVKPEFLKNHVQEIEKEAQEFLNTAFEDYPLDNFMETNGYLKSDFLYTMIKAYRERNFSQSSVALKFIGFDQENKQSYFIDEKNGRIIRFDGYDLERSHGSTEFGTTLNVEFQDKNNNKIFVSVRNDGCFYIKVRNYTQEGKLNFKKTARYRREFNELKISSYKSKDSAISETADFSINSFVYKYAIGLTKDKEGKELLTARLDNEKNLEELSIKDKNENITVLIDKFSNKRPRTVFEL